MAAVLFDDVLAEKLQEARVGHGRGRRSDPSGAISAPDPSLWLLPGASSQHDRTRVTTGASLETAPAQPQLPSHPAAGRESRSVRSPRPIPRTVRARLALNVLQRAGAGGIRDGATDADVRDAYRKLAMCYHPDRNAGADGRVRNRSSAMFAEIAAAYRVITDECRRAASSESSDRT